jgi:hypothetical protein
MTKSPFLLLGLLFAVVPANERLVRELRQETPLGASRTALARGTLAIRNVTVISMASPAPMAGATVLVRDGRIAAAGTTVAVPAGAPIIDGTGKYLIPGLSDMHTHLLSDGGEVHDSAGPAEIGVMLANGVTTARLMIGTPEQLVLRRAVAQGTVVGPQLWVASPQFTGRASENSHVVTTADEARIAVQRAADAGYDFVKITLFITKPVYDAIIDEAKKRSIRVVGHVEPPRRRTSRSSTSTRSSRRRSLIRRQCVRL